MILLNGRAVGLQFGLSLPHRQDCDASDVGFLRFLSGTQEFRPTGQLWGDRRADYASLDRL
jgi:hypothetical protein